MLALHTAMPATPAMLVTLGFPCVTSFEPMLLLTASFSVRGVFLQSASGKNLAGVGHSTLVNADFFYF